MATRNTVVDAPVVDVLPETKTRTGLDRRTCASDQRILLLERCTTTSSPLVATTEDPLLALVSITEFVDVGGMIRAADAVPAASAVTLPSEMPRQKPTDRMDLDSDRIAQSLSSTFAKDEPGPQKDTPLTALPGWPMTCQGRSGRFRHRRPIGRPLPGIAGEAQTGGRPQLPAVTVRVKAWLRTFWLIP